ncbi:MAG: hypothetical protein LBH25_04720 [Fibromonadaceae bacterium]|nr:hypothetical protein [Fibromonadaceae bacterium]
MQAFNAQRLLQPSAPGLIQCIGIPGANFSFIFSSGAASECGGTRNRRRCARLRGARRIRWRSFFFTRQKKEPKKSYPQHERFGPRKSRASRCTASNGFFRERSKAILFFPPEELRKQNEAGEKKE